MAECGCQGKACFWPLTTTLAIISETKVDANLHHLTRRYRNFYKNKNAKTSQELDRLAHDSTKLDPDYPAPLMTQTLAKISNIVRIDFDLIEEVERKQIISDIEHLLVTDFPDEELRRDTRISFAATMLSKLVPKNHVDITEIYEIDKRKSCKINELEYKQKEINKYRDNSDQYTIIEKQIEKLNFEIKELNDSLERIKNELMKKELISFKHSFRLMLKALRDNHEKPKLWVRAIEFCQRSGINEIDSIWEIVDDLLKANSINKLSAGFIYSLILKTLSDQIILAFKEVSELKGSPITYERSKKFLNYLISKEFVTSKATLIKNYTKPYEMGCLNLFMFTCSVIAYYLKEEPTCDLYEYFDKTRNSIFDKNNDGACLVSKDEYSFINMIWWILCKITEKSSIEPPKMWYDVVKYLCHNKELIDSPTGMSIISLYPKNLPAEIIDYLFSSKKMNNYLKHEGWLFDILVSLKDKQINYNGLMQNKMVRKISKILNFTDNEYVTLYEWTEWANKFEKNSVAYDPRLSEWTALEIVKRVAKIHNSVVHNIELLHNSQLFEDVNERYYSVHPSNYILPKEWIECRSNMSWEDWKNAIDIHRNNKTVKLRKLKEVIYDYRYTPVILDPYSYENRELSVIHGLGILLIGLLSKSFSFPAIYNPIGMQKVWTSVLKAKLEYYPISSRTLGIIYGCLSKRNIETKFLSIYQHELVPDDDTIFDPPHIFSISDFIQNIEKAQKILESYQLTVQEYSPRQLIPVSLIQLTRDYNPYKQIEDGIE
ncbi:hypothetical protein [Clostridium thermosuccinogenes]|uniref:hypothetical protein n=2 Tax=Clostridium thermosuccinogenes TaxID=84032 RepID=UPI000CA24A8B|nr:hypothetical protein [Pseudoclostridium thermosuccinogenes]AUS95241.1 hypothetical protein CDO33_01535 [Pseudoclostridium thermosuccinogenes]